MAHKNNFIPTYRFKCPECGEEFDTAYPPSDKMGRKNYFVCPFTGCKGYYHGHEMEYLGPGPKNYLMGEMEYLGTFQSGDLVLRLKVVWPGDYDADGRYWGVREKQRPAYYAFFYHRKPDGCLEKLGMLSGFNGAACHNYEFVDAEEAAKQAIFWAMAEPSDYDEKSPSDRRWKALVDKIDENWPHIHYGDCDNEAMVKEIELEDGHKAPEYHWHAMQDLERLIYTDDDEESEDEDA